ncbi:MULTISPECIES: DUF6153 family protein [Streptomyces]|uniref:DUF2946 domain-containing protein n=1 Tax=Streptomyces dengpaensis TaxID=2049881 RepID=A0ABM6T0N8_9ACTN|nr:MULTISPECIES: DUF6153 family protein [Streptomyces]AVH60526.1 hypothetical protein C4B68_37470 [Streptomyces dengpaensis]PIB07550.1 hypothetical protein B1C81_18585 [Streptomyces sp. HG99]
MTMRAARGNGTAVRWAYGVFLTLCVALAVLVHHETPAADASSMRGSPYATHEMAAEAPQSVSQPSAYSADSGGCAMPGMQHCATASVGTVQLVVPHRSEYDPLVHLPKAVAARAPAGVTGRAPPDLSVLSQLRR